jgi:hypothetical protein
MHDIDQEAHTLHDTIREVVWLRRQLAVSKRHIARLEARLKAAKPERRSHKRRIVKRFTQ